MKICVIRLPGGGQIYEKDTSDELPWKSYKKHEIQTSNYADILTLVKESPEWKFIFVSGGVGAFIYTNLAKNLGGSDSLLHSVGCEVISVLHRILITYFTTNKLSVFPEQVSVNKLQEKILIAHNQCFFVKPEPSFRSTDSLATQSAVSLNSDIIIFLKKGVPTYHIGFDNPTQIHEWPIDDLIARSKELLEVEQSNYVLDYETTLLIKEYGLHAILLNPDKVSEISLGRSGISIMDHRHSTKVVL